MWDSTSTQQSGATAQTAAHRNELRGPGDVSRRASAVLAGRGCSTHPVRSCRALTPTSGWSDGVVTELSTSAPGTSAVSPGSGGRDASHGVTSPAGSRFQTIPALTQPCARHWSTSAASSSTTRSTASRTAGSQPGASLRHSIRDLVPRRCRHDQVVGGPGRRRAPAARRPSTPRERTARAGAARPAGTRTVPAGPATTACTG